MQGEHRRPLGVASSATCNPGARRDRIRLRPRNGPVRNEATIATTASARTVSASPTPPAARAQARCSTSFTTSIVQPAVFRPTPISCRLPMGTRGQPISTVCRPANITSDDTRGVAYQAIMATSRRDARSRTDGGIPLQGLARAPTTSPRSQHQAPVRPRQS